MKRNEAFPGKWLRKEDVTQPIRVTITRVALTDIGTDEEPQRKPAMWFKEDVAPTPINSSNWDVLEGLYGDDSDLWLGKAIEIYVDPDVKFAGRRVGGIRLREPASARAGAPPSSNTKVGSTGNADTSTIERIRAMREAGASLNTIQREVFGFVGGSAYEQVKAALADTTTKLLARWQHLWDDAQSLGLKVEPLPGGATADIIIERGKQLRAAIEGAKVF